MNRHESHRISILERDPDRLAVIPTKVQQLAGDRFEDANVGLSSGDLERPMDLYSGLETG
jgi:hypothetical protein